MCALVQYSSREMDFVLHFNVIFSIMWLLCIAVYWLAISCILWQINIYIHIKRSADKHNVWHVLEDHQSLYDIGRYTQKCPWGDARRVTCRGYPEVSPRWPLDGFAAYMTRHTDEHKAWARTNLGCGTDYNRCRYITRSNITCCCNCSDWTETKPTANWRANRDCLKIMQNNEDSVQEPWRPSDDGTWC